MRQSRRCLQLLLLPLICLVALAGSGMGSDLSGSYGVNGSNPNGTVYHGTATIRMTSDSCRVNWKTGASTSSGYCRLEGDTFTVDFVLLGGKGVVVYKVLRNGDMDGVWWMNGHEAMKGKEKLLLRKLSSPSV